MKNLIIWPPRERSSLRCLNPDTTKWKSFSSETCFLEFCIFFFFLLLPKMPLYSLTPLCDVIISNPWSLIIILNSPFDITPRSCAVPCFNILLALFLLCYFVFLLLCMWTCCKQITSSSTYFLCWLVLQYSSISMCSKTSPGCHRPADSWGCSTVVHSLATGQTNKIINKC